MEIALISMPLFFWRITMKRILKQEENCIGCKICEQTCSDHNYGGIDKTSIKVTESGVGYQIQVCNQCGVCIDICPVEAIYRDNDGIVRIKEDICVACFMCVGFCPENAMFYHKDSIIPFKCISCGACADECPADAINLEV
jgi:Fe-S-cluster-containing hydrogenase component 2